jgi:hypothetical protein
MKKCFVGLVALLLASSLMLTGCRRSTEDLAKEVKASIEETWGEQDLDINIQEFTLVKKSDTEYKGILKVSANGETESLVVNVTVDGDSFMWEVDY